MKPNLKFITILIIACFIIAVIVLIFNHSGNNSTTNSTNQEYDRMVRIATNSDIVQSYLANQTYSVSSVSTGSGYVLFNIGNTSEYWNKLLVGVNQSNDNVTYTYLSNQYDSAVNPQSTDPDKEALMINIALSNNTVESIIGSNRSKIQSIDLGYQSLVIATGEPYFLHQINVGVDVNNRTVTSVNTMMEGGPGPFINNTSN